jgi:hypothetical protein
MTEVTYLARVPYAGPVEIGVTKTLVNLTTNKAELTVSREIKAVSAFGGIRGFMRGTDIWYPLGGTAEPSTRR